MNSLFIAFFGVFCLLKFPGMKGRINFRVSMVYLQDIFREFSMKKFNWVKTLEITGICKNLNFYKKIRTFWRKLSSPKIIWEEIFWTIRRDPLVLSPNHYTNILPNPLHIHIHLHLHQPSPATSLSPPTYAPSPSPYNYTSTITKPKGRGTKVENFPESKTLRTTKKCVNSNFAKKWCLNKCLRQRCIIENKGWTNQKKAA